MKPAGVRLTAQLPVNLSPMLRPTHHHISPSPRLQASHPDSSSSSSITSSPIQSPRTNPSDSPRKESFDLPPLAYKEGPVFAFPGSMPVKIPNLISKTPQTHTPGTHTPASNGHSIGASIDTLRFGRKPGLVNSVTSPNALAARCACGKPANHRGRALSKDRGIESGLANFVLGPSVTYPEPIRMRRQPDSPKPLHKTFAATGHNTPDNLEFDSSRSSLLSRSRSDPIPSSLENRPANKRSPIAQRVSNHRADALTSEGAIAPPSLRNVTVSSIAPSVASPRRGRSRERQPHPVDRDMSVGLLNHPPEREHPPSRSRHRREEGRLDRRRSDSRERQRTAASPVVAEPPQIMPSWNRRPSPTAGPGEGVAPTMRKTGSGRSAEVHDDRREDLRRASNQLGAVFGVAAG